MNGVSKLQNRLSSPGKNYQYLHHLALIISTLIPVTICVLIITLRNHYNPVFASTNNGWIDYWIEDCRYRAQLDNPDPGNWKTDGMSFNLSGNGINELRSCSTFLRCVLTQGTPDYPTYWSTASSILAFIPTIVGLLSNSIDEIVAVADESLLLALSLALSSTVSFSSRFGNYEISPMFEHDPAYVAAAKKRITNRVAKELRYSETSQSRRWFMRDKLLFGAAIAALGICAFFVWYCVWKLTRDGTLVWSCANKFHTALWVALSQVLAVLSIAGHPLTYNVARIRIPNMSQGIDATMGVLGPGDVSNPHKPGLHNAPLLGSTASKITIVLRCHRSGWKRWIVQTVSSIIAFGLYTFSTVVLASMTLIAPKDAVLMMVAFSVAAGISRMVGQWAKSSLRSGKTVLCFDIPEIHMVELRDQLRAQVEWQNLGTEMLKTA